MSGLEQNQCVAKESVWPFPETLFSEKALQTPRRKSLRQQRGLFKVYRIRTNRKSSLSGTTVLQCLGNVKMILNLPPSGQKNKEQISRIEK